MSEQADHHVPSSSETSAEEVSHTAPLKALLELYEKGNKTGFSSHSIVDEEVQILRGFVRSRKSIFEQLSTTTGPGSNQLKPSDGVRTLRKWEKPKKDETKPEVAETPLWKPEGPEEVAQKATEAVVLPSNVKETQRKKSLEQGVLKERVTPHKPKPVIPEAATQARPEEPLREESLPQPSLTPPLSRAQLKLDDAKTVIGAQAGNKVPVVEKNTPVVEQITITVEGESIDPEGEAEIEAVEIGEESESSESVIAVKDNARKPLRPRFSIALTDSEDTVQQPTPVYIEEAFERLKQSSQTNENKEVTRLQRRLTKALSTDTSQQKLQALILDALAREEDEEVMTLGKGFFSFFLSFSSHDFLSFSFFRFFLPFLFSDWKINTASCHSRCASH